MKIESSMVNLLGSHNAQYKETELTETTTEQDQIQPVTRAVLKQSNLTYNAKVLSQQSQLANNNSIITSADQLSSTSYQQEYLLSQSLAAVLTKEASVFNVQPLTSSSNLQVNSQQNNQTVVPEKMTFDTIRQVTESEELQVQGFGKVTLADGKQIDFAMELNMQRDFELTENLSLKVTETAFYDPLVLNLDGGGTKLQNTTFNFDMDADGTDEEISFVRQGSGLLVFDHNSDGKIKDGSEVVGALSGNAFADLASFDSDGNQWIDENDEVYHQLSVWLKSDDGQDVVLSLSQVDVGAIYVGSTESNFNLTDGYNNLQGKVNQTGLFLKNSGEVASMQQIDFADQSNNQIALELDQDFNSTFENISAKPQDMLASAPPEITAGIDEPESMTDINDLYNLNDAQSAILPFSLNEVNKEKLTQLVNKIHLQTKQITNPETDNQKQQYSQQDSFNYSYTEKVTVEQQFAANINLDALTKFIHYKNEILEREKLLTEMLFDFKKQSEDKQKLASIKASYFT